MTKRIKKDKMSTISQSNTTVLGDITNHQQQKKRDYHKNVLQNLKTGNSIRQLVSHKYFLEDNEKPACKDMPKTKNYSMVNFTTNKPDKRLKFVCFNDRELNIKMSFQQIIPHSCDNDCSTDDEQIKGAIKT